MSSPLLAALSAAPGPHPPLAELRAYAAGEVAGPAAQQLEAHTLHCVRCADVLIGLQETDAATTDRALTQLQRRLRQRVRELSPPPVALLPATHFRRAWPRLAAAAELVAGLGAGIWGWQQHQQIAPKTTLAVAQSAAAAAAPKTAATASAPAEVSAAPPAGAPRAGIRAAARRQPATTPTVRRPATGLPATAEAKADQEIAVAAVRPLPAPAAEGIVASAGVGARAAHPDSLGEGQLSKVARSAGYADAPAAPIVAKAEPGLATTTTAADTFRSPVDTAFPAGTVALAQSAQAAAVRRVTLPPPPLLEPMPRGGYKVLRAYLRQKAAEFEPEPGRLQLKGLVRVRLTISAAGKLEVEGAEVLRSLRPDYDAEVLRMLADGPAWVPGVAKGRRAPLPVQVEVRFE